MFLAFLLHQVVPTYSQEGTNTTATGASPTFAAPNHAGRLGNVNISSTSEIAAIVFRESSCRDQDASSVITNFSLAFESFSQDLTTYVEGADLDLTGRRHERRTADSAVGGLSLKRAARSLTNSVIPGAPILNEAIGFLFDQQTSRQVAAEFDSLNQRLDTLESILKNGFDHLQNVITLNDANIVLDDFNHRLDSVYNRFLDFSAPDLEENTRAVYREQFRQSCNTAQFLPTDIFRFFYRHACSDCDALDLGGSKAASYFLPLYRSSAEDILDFRQGFGVIMMSALARAIFLHAVCIPIVESDRCSDPIWLGDMEEMAVALEEVAGTLEVEELSFGPMTQQNWVVYSSGCEFQATFTVTCPDENAYFDHQSLLPDNVPSCEKIGFSVIECTFDSSLDSENHSNMIASVVHTTCEQSVPKVTMSHVPTPCDVLAYGTGNRSEFCLTPLSPRAFEQGYDGCFQMDLAVLNDLESHLNTSEPKRGKRSKRFYLAVFVPVGSVLLLILIVLCLCCCK